MRNIHIIAVFVDNKTNIVIDKMTVTEDPKLKEGDLYVSVENNLYRIIESKKVWNSRKESVNHIYLVNDTIEDDMVDLILYLD